MTSWARTAGLAMALSPITARMDRNIRTATRRRLVSEMTVREVWMGSAWNRSMLVCRLESVIPNRRENM